MFHVKQCSWKTTRIRFGRIASLSAFVLFAGGCVVRIAYECFLDCSLLEVFCFQDGEQQILVSLRFQYHLINTFVKGDSLSPIFKGCLALLSLRDISPHCGESSLSAELSQLDRSCLRLVSYNPPRKNLPRTIPQTAIPFNTATKPHFPQFPVFLRLTNFRKSPIIKSVPIEQLYARRFGNAAHFIR